ncbi:MAG: hypothetical protein M3R14_13610 [Acidobacteriota bacterium]|nr:hypothetical protein [Acidobacteriota bacterium]
METIISQESRVESRESEDERPKTEDQTDKTLADSGFYWREKNGVKILVCRVLEEIGFVNGFSTRLGGVSPFPENSQNLSGLDIDLAENLAENRKRFLEVFGGVTGSPQVGKHTARTCESSKISMTRRMAITSRTL